MAAKSASTTSEAGLRRMEVTYKVSKFQPPSFNNLVVYKGQLELEQTFLLYKLRSTKLLFEESEVDRISSWLF